MSWAAAEMAGAFMWDRRCNRSLVRICDRRFLLPHVSFSRACGEDGRQAAHRIFGSKKTTIPGVLAGHFRQSRERCVNYLLANPKERILVAQDTTTFKYTTHIATEGLGPIHVSEAGRGLHSHAAIAMPRHGPPFGVVHLSIWARELAEHGKRRDAAARTKDPIEIKESQKWIDGMWGAEAALPDLPLLVICDREADIFELFAAPRQQQTELLVRSRHPRRILVDSQTKTVSLPDALDASPLLGVMEAQIPRAPGRRARLARLELRVCKVTMKPPGTLPPPMDGGKHPNQTVYAIEAREVGIDVPEPIRWVLLTTEPVVTAAEAEEMVRCYTRRWEIEEMHLVLKSGLRAEQLQLDDAHSLKNALSLLYVVAWRVLFTRDTARFTPGAPADQLVNPEELEVLEAIESKQLKTVRDVTRAIAHFGGFPRYPSAGEPGVRTICAGLQRLEGAVIGYRAAKRQLKI
jgi:hypothetical protein